MRRALVAWLTIYLLFTIAISARALWLHSKAVSSTKESREGMTSLRDIRKTIDSAKNMKATKFPDSMAVVSRFQAMTERVAGQNKCNVSEFRASALPMIYSTRFASDTTTKGWQQISVDLTMSGTLRNILDMTNGFVKQDLPFEYDAIDLTRTKIDKTGDATVTAHVLLRVLFKGGAE